MNGGIINSVTRLHLVDYFYWIILFTLQLLRSSDFFKDVCGKSCIFVITDLMKTLNKRSRSTHFCSVTTHIWISGVTAVFGITHMRWIHQQSELGGNSSQLHYGIGKFHRKLPVKFHHQTSYLWHVLSAVNKKSQFDIYFKSRKIQLNKTSI